MTSPTHLHQCAGVTIAADRPLELDPGSSNPDLFISKCPEDIWLALFWQAAPANSSGAFKLQCLPQGWLFHIDGVGAFFLTADHIRYRFRPGLAARQENQFLMGVVFAFWLETTGCIVLHGAAVEVGTGAVALIGAKGAGKSSLALTLTAAGHRLIADDQVVVDFRASTPRVRPTTPWIKAWPDTLRALSSDPDRWHPVHGATIKRQIVLPIDRRVPSPVPLRRVFVLRRSAHALAIAKRPLDPSEAMRELLRHATVPRLLAAAGLSAGRLAALAMLVNQVGIEELLYPGDWRSIADIEGAVSGVGSSG